MAPIIFRPVTDDEYPAFVKAVVEGFSDDIPNDELVDSVKSTLPPDRTLAAFDNDEIVGTFAGFDLDLTVPGGHLPMEGTTVVTVFPTHRRMGLMNEMMQRHLDAATSNGYAIAGLWASDSSLYGQYGYGPATTSHTVEMTSDQIEFREGLTVDRVRRIGIDDALVVLPSLYEEVCEQTPGMYRRNEPWWLANALLDKEWSKFGKTSKRIVVHDGEGGPDGYVIYRQKPASSDDGHADGAVAIVELVAGTDRAHTALWHYVTNVDGCPNVRFGNASVDDPLAMKLVAPRRVRVAKSYDALWIVLLDVVRALEARTYEQDGSLRIGIESPFRSESAGAYELVVEDGRPSVTRTTGETDVEVDLDALGALYLGGGDAHAYAAASRIRGRTDKVALLHTMFRTAQAPWCNEVF